MGKEARLPFKPFVVFDIEDGQELDDKGSRCVCTTNCRPPNFVFMRAKPCSNSCTSNNRWLTLRADVTYSETSIFIYVSIFILGVNSCV